MGTGSHIIYVNGSYRDDTPIGKLMYDFSCTQPADMNYGILGERDGLFKESKEGIAIMCKVMEDMRNETLKECMIDVTKRMLSDGKLPLEKIAEYAGLPLEEVQELELTREDKMESLEQYEGKCRADDFGTVMPDGRLTEISSGKIYRLREAILESKRLGRPLTDDEMKKYEVI